MSSFLMVEASDEPSHVMTRLPTQGGNGVLNFLLALNWFCDVDATDPLDKKPREWFEYLQTQIEQPICNIFKPMIDCVWGDDGRFEWDYLEDEYEWYLKRNAQAETKLTEAEFRNSVAEGTKHWSPIDLMLANVKLLLNALKIEGFRENEGQYTFKELTEDIIPGFESLYDTLIILKKFGLEIVRLTFY